MAAHSPTDLAATSFLDLAGHPVRWLLLRELAHSDRRVDEMIEVVQQPQSLVSYHLGRLRDGGLVTSRRSSKDGRASYYHLDLDRFGASLSQTGAALHPGLDLAQPIPLSPTLRHRETPTVRVLFVCTGNSARSQIAEALLGNVCGSAIEVASAGSNPKPVHHLAVKALAARGIDISDWRSKPLSDFAGQDFEYVISLCDKVREQCPEAPGHQAIHWSIEDPTNGGRVDLARFESLTTDLEIRVRWLIWIIRSHETIGGTRHDN